MADPRFEKINELFINYSLGNFDYKINLSSKKDEIDAFISNINMLGEELKATTISKNYFNNIFHSVSDMLFVLNHDGTIQSINKAVTNKLGYTSEFLANKPVEVLLDNEQKHSFLQIRNEMSNNKGIAEFEAGFISSQHKRIPAYCSVNYLTTEKKDKVDYLLIGRDITRQKEIENLVIRTIVDTQENERKRFAEDLHDSLQQPLSSIIFYLSALSSGGQLNKNAAKQILSKSQDGLQGILKELRNVCFNLMPRTLEEHGLPEAVKELCKKIRLSGMLEFNIAVSEDFPSLEKPCEIAIFRIIQEFINNSIKHGKAKNISIKMSNNHEQVCVFLKDDGKGFDKNKSGKFEGMGLRNVRSRVQSYNGDVKIESRKGRGTSYEIIIPIK